VNIHLKAQLTAQDHADSQRLHLGFRAHFIFGATTLAVIVLVLCLTGDPFNKQSWAFAGCIWLIGLSVFFPTLSWGTVKRSAKIFAQQKGLQLAHEIEITDDEIITSSAGRGEWKTPSNEYHKWKGNERLVLVYVSDRLFRMFPRRWFASDAEFQGFKDLLTRSIGPEGKARKRPKS
jgi:hypothetical protein